MSHLFQALAAQVDTWRAAAYPCPEGQAIREVLEFAVEDAANGQLRYLRRTQFRALETYWYLRLVLDSPRQDHPRRPARTGRHPLRTTPATASLQAIRRQRQAHLHPRR